MTLFTRSQLSRCTVAFAVVAGAAIAVPPAHAQIPGMPKIVFDPAAHGQLVEQVANDVKTFSELYVMYNDAHQYYYEWEYQMVQMKDIGSFTGKYLDTMLVGIGNAQLSHDIDSLGPGAKNAIAVLNGGPLGLVNQAYDGLVLDLEKPNSDGGVLYNAFGPGTNARRDHDQIALCNTIAKHAMAVTSTFRKESAQLDRHLEQLDIDTTGDSQATVQILQRTSAATLEGARAMKYGNEMRAAMSDLETCLNMSRAQARTEASNMNADWQQSWNKATTSTRIGGE